jgi:hypothetical protein
LLVARERNNVQLQRQILGLYSILAEH